MACGVDLQRSILLTVREVCVLVDVLLAVEGVQQVACHSVQAQILVGAPIMRL